MLQLTLTFGPPSFQWYLEIYCGWVNFIVNSLVPYVVLLSLNAAILHHLEAFSLAQTEGQLGAENMKKDVLLAKVSLVIVGVFIFCHSFRWIPTIYELYQVGINKYVLGTGWPACSFFLNCSGD